MKLLWSENEKNSLQLILRQNERKNTHLEIIHSSTFSVLPLSFKLSTLGYTKLRWTQQFAIDSFFVEYGEFPNWSSFLNTVESLISFIVWKWYSHAGITISNFGYHHGRKPKSLRKRTKNSATVCARSKLLKKIDHFHVDITTFSLGLCVLRFSSIPNVYS